MGRVASAAEPVSEQPVEAQLEVAADARCATRAALAERIVERSSRIRLVEGGAPRRVRAEIAQGRHGVRATLRIVHPNGRRSVRRIEAETCDEALDALGLIAAITLDPSSAWREALPEKTANDTEPARPDGASAEPPNEARRPSPRLVPPRVERAPDEPTSASVRFATGVTALGTVGPAPGALPGAGVYVSVEREAEGALRPAARLGVSHARRGGFPAGSGRADFALTELTLELCPVALSMAIVRVRPCAAASGGILTARASGVLESRSADRPLWAFGASGLVSVEPARWLEIVALVRGAAPLARDRYQIEPVVFHRVAGVAVTAGAGAGVRFP